VVSFETVKLIRSNLWQFAILVVTLITLLAVPVSTSAEVKASRSAFPPLSPSEIIASINNYRNQNGLLSLQTNTTLTILAQGHAEYQAAINTVTHTGPGGSTPKGRAISAGYAGGSVTYFAEIIYGGTNTTPSNAIDWWKDSPIHNEMMLAPAFNELGAGVSSDGNWNYYTVEFGYSTGAGPSGSSSSTGSDGDDSPPAPSIIYAVPVVKATPREDGSVIHVLKTGQVPWTLAVVYEVDLDLLLEQNGLTRFTFVHTGDEIVIVPSHTPAPETPTPQHTPTSTITPSPSVTPTSKVTNTPLATSTEESSSEEVESNSGNSEDDANPNSAIRWAVIAAFAIFIAVIFGSMFTSKTTDHSKDEDSTNQS
jgi:uncharacterized protein YkwD